MPSPFPGMDPYLEDPGLWPDFHDALASEIRVVLNHTLPEPYYAQLGMREELGIVGNGTPRRIIPDVAVARSSPPASERPAAAAVLDEPRSTVSSSVEVIIELDREEVSFVEIHDARSEHEVITLIEILSYSNKQPGPDRDKYIQKRQEILGSRTSLVEIDLLRAGDRSWHGPEVYGRLYEFDSQPEYLALVNRAWRRTGRLAFQLFPISISDPLPVIDIPLREGESEATLDLQYAFQQTYDGGPYQRGAVDYSRPPINPLSGELESWVANCVRQYRALQ